jgi:hypothetical protein
MTWNEILAAVDDLIERGWTDPELSAADLDGMENDLDERRDAIWALRNHRVDPR